MAKNSNYLFKLDLLILSILQDQDMYGYEITKYITNISHGKIIPKHGTLYPIIYNLLEKKYISGNTVLVGNKARVYYHIEDAGKEYLSIIRKDYDELVECINLIVHGREN